MFTDISKGLITSIFRVKEQNVHGSYCCLLGLFFKPEDGGGTFLQNVSELISER
jgi:hypothetical protein